MGEQRVRPGDTVIFLHIPKTAGSTLYEILDHSFRLDEILTFDGYNHSQEITEFIRAPETERGRYQLIKGHMFFGLHRHVPGRCVYFTMLRDPMARLVSFFKHASREPKHYLHGLINQEAADLKTLLRMRASSELFNHQTRMIAGGDWRDANRRVDRSALDQAKRNLRDRFDVVGVTEEFDASLLLLRQRIRRTVPVYLKRNVAPKCARLNQAIDGETRKLLREANLLDLELHRFARELFSLQRRAAGLRFKIELRRFRILNAAYQGWMGVRQKSAQVIRNRYPRLEPRSTSAQTDYA
jgi:hypothetical protein